MNATLNRSVRGCEGAKNNKASLAASLVLKCDTYDHVLSEALVNAEQLAAVAKTRSETATRTSYTYVSFSGARFLDDVVPLKRVEIWTHRSSWRNLRLQRGVFP